MQTGDVIFFKAKDTKLSKFISFVTKSPYTHVGLCLDEHRIIEANRFIKTRIIDFEMDENVHVLYRLDDLNDEQRSRIYTNALKYERIPYDYLQVVMWFFRLVFDWNIPIVSRANKLVCSELIDYVFVNSGVYRSAFRPIGDVTPGELLEVYMLKEVKT